VFQAGIRDALKQRLNHSSLFTSSLNKYHVLPKLGDRISVSTLGIPKILGNPGKANKTLLLKELKWPKILEIWRNPE